MPVDPADSAAVAAFVRRHGLGVVATVDDQGMPEAALVGVAATDGGTLIFNSHAEARKVANLSQRPGVAVVVGFDGGESVQIEGVATILTGVERERVGTVYNAQFPGSRALDEQFVLISVAVSWVRTYDANVSPALVAEASWADSSPRR